MSANLRFEGNFFVLRDLLTSNFKISAEVSDEIFKTFGGRNSFFSELTFFSLLYQPACITSQKENKF